MSEEYVKPDSTNFKLSYRVVKVSSQDMNYPVTELLITDIEQTRGLQSQRFWEYPQEIILEFPCKVKLKHVQILFHNSKIPSKIKLYSMDKVEQLESIQEESKGNIALKKPTETPNQPKNGTDAQGQGEARDKKIEPEVHNKEQGIHLFIYIKQTHKRIYQKALKKNLIQIFRRQQKKNNKAKL